MTRVAIIGGGCGGVAAAFWLTAPQLARRFDVTLYSHGWRLGGKGASGRAMTTPDRRIHEHGLHLWMGAYDRAFQMMRLAYAEQANPKPYATLDAAFEKICDFTLESLDGQGAPPVWSPWPVSFPPATDFLAINSAPDFRTGHARFQPRISPLDSPICWIVSSASTYKIRRSSLNPTKR